MPPPRFPTRLRSPAAVAVLLCVQAALLAHVAATAAAVTDETAHLAAGLAQWRFGRFDAYSVNPPLVKAVAAVPLALGGSRVDWRPYSPRHGTRKEWDLGRAWVDANGTAASDLLTRARWAVVPLVVIGGWVCARWASDLHGGRWAGPLACGLWCLNPSLLANGALATPDAAAAAAGVGAGYAFWRFLNDRRLSTAVLAGAAAGVANLCKMTWVFLFGLWPLLWAFWLLRDRGRDGAVERGRGREAALICVVLATACFTLNAGYGFDGTGTPLGGFRFVSRTLGGDDAPGNRFAVGPLAGLPAPVPRDWLLGVDLQRRDFEEPARCYLFGEWREGGWPHYYAAAFLVKEPTGFFLLAAVAAWGSGLRRRDAVVLLAPAAAVFLLVSSQTAMNRHPRYLLPAYGFLLVWAAGAARFPAAFRGRSRRAAAVVVAVGAAAYGAAGVSCHPHPHAFFNLPSGGPLRGHESLADTATDWGQPLRALGRWQAAHPDRPLDGIADVGLDPHRLYGLTDAPVPPRPRPGRWALSARLLAEPRYAGWAALEPSEIVGGNMRIYELDALEPH